MPGASWHRLGRLGGHLSPLSAPSLQAESSDDWADPFAAERRTLAPEAISAELLPTVEAFGLVENCRELAEQGWTIVRDAASPEFVARRALRPHPWPAVMIPYHIPGTLACIPGNALPAQRQRRRLTDALLIAPCCPIRAVRETTLRLGREGEYLGAVYSALAKDDVFAEAVLNPKVAAMAEFSVGRGNLLGSLIGT